MDAAEQKDRLDEAIRHAEAALEILAQAEAVRSFAQQGIIQFDRARTEIIRLIDEFTNEIEKAYQLARTFLDGMSSQYSSG